MDSWKLADFKVDKCRIANCRGAKFYHSNYCYKCLHSEGYDFLTGIMVKKN